MGIGKNIAKILKQNGKTVTWLAEQTGIKRSTLSAYLNKDSNVLKPELIYAVSDLCGAPLTEILGLERKESFIDYVNDTSQKYTITEVVSQDLTKIDHYRIMSNTLDDDGSVFFVDFDFDDYLLLKNTAINNVDKQIEKFIQFLTYNSKTGK